jgi:hypothetical protein
MTAADPRLDVASACAARAVHLRGGLKRLVRLRGLVRRTAGGGPGLVLPGVRDQSEDLPQRGGAAVEGPLDRLRVGQALARAQLRERALDRQLGPLELVVNPAEAEHPWTSS